MAEVKVEGQEAAGHHGNSHNTGWTEMATDLPADVQQEIDDLYHFVPEVTSHFTVIDKIGEGTFSSVFLARLRHHPDIAELFALKHIIPTSHPNRILGELTCLQLFGGKNNVMGLELCLRNKDHIVIVMRYFPHHKFQDYFNTVTVDEVRDYMRHLLVALQSLHRRDVIHRDVKPSNFLHNMDTKQYALVDFGLAHDAPVKLHADNAGRPPLIKEHRTPKADKSRPSPRQQRGRSGETRGVLPPPPSFAAERGRAQPPGPGDGGRKGEGEERGRRVPPFPGNPVPERALCSRPRGVPRAKGVRGSAMIQPPCVRPEPVWGEASGCSCYGRPVICSVCMGRSVQSAQRAGTPGFRAPEVLMKHPHQTTAVDMWSAGVILLSLLSGRYPFFRGNDDMTCLSQITSLLGTERVQKAAATFDKTLTCRPVTRPHDLKSLCERLRSSPEGSGVSQSSSYNPTRPWPEVPASAVTLLTRLLDPNPATRITASQALQLDFFTTPASPHHRPCS